MVTETACLIGDSAGHQGGYAFHGVDCLPDLIEVNRQVFVTKRIDGRCALTSLLRTALGRPK